MMIETGTLTRADLADAVHRNIGLSRAECSAMVESILVHMSDALGKGENVKITGFGTFSVRKKDERIGRNPKTGVEVPIPARRVISFRPSLSVKARIEQS
jgi:integration host factor subunit alpha